MRWIWGQKVTSSEVIAASPWSLAFITTVGALLFPIVGVGCAEGGSPRSKSGTNGFSSFENNVTEEDLSDTDEEILPCDDGFFLSPVAPDTSQVNKVSYESGLQGYTYVDFSFEGPGTVVHDNLKITGKEELGDRWRWTWDTTFSEGGVYTVYFEAGEIEETERPSCQFRVADNGTPPNLEEEEPAFDDPNCAKSCPVVGTSLYGYSEFPLQGHDQWITLNSAGNCDEGHCRVWCPHDYDTPGSHYTEAAWLNWEERFMNYEEACKSYCERETEGEWNDEGHFCGPAPQP